MGNTHWRKFEQNGSWTIEYQNQLKTDIQSEKLDEDSKTRILFWGPVKAGKSSVLNSFASVDENRPANVAVSSGCTSSRSVTTKLHIVVLSERMKNIQLLDIMGLENGTLDGFNPDDVKFLLEGNLKNGFPFDPNGVKIEEKQSHLFVANPTIAENAHCNVLVIAAKDVDPKTLPKEMLQKLTNVCKHSNNNGVATIVLLTHIEDVCDKVARDVKAVFSSPKIKEVVDTAHELFGVREMDIFPIKNYTGEAELSIPMNILLLLALRQIVRYAVDRIRNIARNREQNNI